ncbi:unnamed protein product [Angiostrongylus costaricensis]|uniref:Dynein_C domain-containing protein n=1 Tax=Angiostrongylus costaricensis TaxID=334426 RepID=A0A0R3PDT8_ANGCS|nr:unnamed protein product [Angiostrongylus costaricensis]
MFNDIKMLLLVAQGEAALQEFSKNALSWEENLSQTSAMFDIWTDSQRRWAYLEGLLPGSAAFQHYYSLPLKVHGFPFIFWFGHPLICASVSTVHHLCENCNVCTEFLPLMKKVTQPPRILDMIGMQEAQRLLGILANTLSKIQKALDFVKRFLSLLFGFVVFVEGDDLLEIMGNRKDISRLQKNLKKILLL